MWIGLIKLYWQILLFRDSPANTPYSSMICFFWLFTYFLLTVSRLLILTPPDLHVSTTIRIDLALFVSSAVYTYAVLYLYRVPTRFLQSFTTLFATHTLLYAMDFALLVTIVTFFNDNGPVVLVLSLGIIYFLLRMILTVWQFVVTVYIYKQALSLNNISAVLVSLGLLASNMLTISLSK